MGNRIYHTQLVHKKDMLHHIIFRVALNKDTVLGFSNRIYNIS